MPPKSKLGQNFLRDESAVARMIYALGDISQATVLEIGPGHGALTHQLAQKAKRLIAVEVDPALAAELRAGLILRENFTLIEKSILEVDLAEVARDAEAERLVVVGNLPYYITSEILLDLLAAHRVIDRAVLMVQREVAERVTASPGSRDYGLLTVTVGCHARASQLFTLPPEAFSPPPLVHSTVMRLSFAPRFAELEVEPAAFDSFLKRCFAQKRKTLMNNLRAAGYGSGEQAMLASGIDAQARAETLSLAQFASLFRALARKSE